MRGIDRLYDRALKNDKVTVLSEWSHGGMTVHRSETSHPPRHRSRHLPGLGRVGPVVWWQFLQVRVRWEACGGAFAEYERALIRSRTREGMAAVRARGARIGRPAVLTVEQAAAARRLHAGGESVSLIARVLGVSRSTIQRACR